MKGCLIMTDVSRGRKKWSNGRALGAIALERQGLDPYDFDKEPFGSGRYRAISARYRAFDGLRIIVQVSHAGPTIVIAVATVWADRI